MAVQCPNCQTENRDEAKFCCNCVRPLEMMNQLAAGAPAELIVMEVQFTSAETMAPVGQAREHAGFWIRIVAGLIELASISAGTTFLFL